MTTDFGYEELEKAFDKEFFHCPMCGELATTKGAALWLENQRLKKLLSEAAEYMEYQPSDWQEKMDDVFQSPS